MPGVENWTERPLDIIQNIIGMFYFTNSINVQYVSFIGSCMKAVIYGILIASAFAVCDDSELCPLRLHFSCRADNCSGG